MKLIPQRGRLKGQVVDFPFPVGRVLLERGIALRPDDPTPEKKEDDKPKKAVKKPAKKKPVKRKPRVKKGKK